MSIRILKKALGLLIVDIVIIIGIFVLQFRTDSTIIKKIGNLQISLEALDDQNGVVTYKNTARISYNGINFYFDDQNPASIKKDDKSSVVLSVPFLKVDEKNDKNNKVIDIDNIPVIQSTSDVLNSSIRSGASNVTTLANSSAPLRRSDKDLLKTGTLNSGGTVGINSNIPKVKIGKEDKPEIKKLDDIKIDEIKLDDKSINKSDFIDIPSILRQ